MFEGFIVFFQQGLELLDGFHRDISFQVGVLFFLEL